MSERLTEPQRRHLTEMLDKPFWTPANSGEMRCATTLWRRGYLVRHQVPYSRDQYEITEEGRKATAPPPAPKPERKDG